MTSYSFPNLSNGWRVVIHGGDGERQGVTGDPNDQNQPEPEPKDDPEPTDSDDVDDVDDEKDDDKPDSGPSVEEQLAAERRARLKAQRENKRLKDAKTEAQANEDAAKDRDRYKTENDGLKKILNSSFLEWQISSEKKYDWEDVEDVRKALDMEAIEINLDTGEVEGLTDELKRIAKKKPHWIKKPKKEDDEEPPRGGPSGGHPTGGRTTPTELSDKQKIGAKYKIPGFGSQSHLKVM